MIRKRKLKPVIVTGMYMVVLCMVAIGVYIATNMISGSMLKDKKNNDSSKQVSDDFFNDTNDVPVVNIPKVMTKPYNLEEIKIGKNFYDYLSDASMQENSLIYYEGTYMQNSGITYVYDNEFDVVSSYEGVVSDIKEDEILGKIVYVTHSNDLVTVYQGLSSINVSKDDIVATGSVIGKSGFSNVNKDLGNHLHFEVHFQGKVINPENIFGKEIDKLLDN